MTDDRTYLKHFTDTTVVNGLMVNASGRIAFDIGANGGYVAKLLARAFDKVVAVEPCWESYQYLTPRCPMPGLVPLNVAVSDHIGTLTLGVKKFTETIGELFTGDSLEEWGPDFETRDVPCTTLDELAKVHGYPDFVKIDTEGHEALIVDGGYNVFVQNPKFIIEIHDERWGKHIQERFDEMHLGYKIIRHNLYPVGEYNYLNHYWMVNR